MPPRWSPPVGLGANLTLTFFAIGCKDNCLKQARGSRLAEGTFFLILAFIESMRTRLLILSIFLAHNAFTQLTYQNLFVDYDSAITYKNLKLIPIRWKPAGAANACEIPNMVAFGEAMQQGLITV